MTTYVKAVTKPMSIIACDPHVKKTAIACWNDQLELNGVLEIDTDKFIKDPSDFIEYNMVCNNIAVIESQYLGSSKQTGKPFINSTIKLAQHAGMIAGSLIRSNFEIVWAPPWGMNGWIATMLSQNGRIPNTKQVALLSKMIVKRLNPELKFNEHQAAAILMGNWFITKLRTKNA
jgi:hypothetical protein